jgi:uracil-DNA glycosylase family 4
MTKKEAATLLWWYAQQGLTSAIFDRPPAAPTVPEESQPFQVFASTHEALSDLHAQILSFQGCPLSKTAQHTVFSGGNPNSPVMLVGEAPGAEEDKQGKPFVGMSGKLLDLMLASIGLDRTTVYITNIMPWRPPFNRQPSTQEVADCLPFVERHIGIINPKLLICVGGVAYKSLTRSNASMTSVQGKIFDYACPYLPRPIKAMALYHPAYLLRSPGQKRTAWHQLLRIKAFLQE